MTLTREQIEDWRERLLRSTWLPGKTIQQSQDEVNALCALALSAFDMREMAARVCEVMSKEHEYGKRYVLEDAASIIRAIPIPEQGAAPENREPAELLPGKREPWECYRCGAQINDHWIYCYCGNRRTPA